MIMNDLVSSGARVVPETACPGGMTVYRNPEWAERWPWLVQGVTGRRGPDTQDMSLFAASPSGQVQERWRRLLRSTGFDRAVHARQVHGAAVRLHDEGPPGLLLAPDADGHVTARSGLLLTVSVADCVPVWIVDPERRVIGLLHAGWRGVVAGILEAGLRVLEARLGLPPAGVVVHLGPAICGRCYEVGPEVHEALGLPECGAPAPVDLRAGLAHRAVRSGVPAESVTVSDLCTRCGGGGLYSHRAGDPERQLAYVGVRP